MKEVVLCFLDIESNMLRSSWLNSWAAKLAPTSRHKRPPQVHVELFFRDGNSDEGHCTSIVYNKKIHWFRKKFSRQWSFRSIWMEDNTYAKLKAFCLQHVGCGFNKIGFFLNQTITGYVEELGKYGLDLDNVRFKKLKNRRELESSICW